MILTDVQKTITLPNCTLYKCGLSIDEAASDQDLQEIGRTLNAIEQCGLWWWGDYLNNVEAKKGEKYTQALAESCYSYSSLKTAKWVTSRLELSMRMDTLSFTHHQDALVECDGDSAKALEWLSAAAKGEWTVSEMRKRIRISRMGYDNTGEKGQRSVYDYLKEVKRWFRSSIDTAKPELLNELRSDLTQMLEAINERLAK